MISFIKYTNTGKANLCIGYRIIQRVTAEEQKEAPWSAGRCLFFILNSDCQLQQVRLQCLNSCSGFLHGSAVENLPGIQEMHGDAYSIPGSGRSPEEGIATRFSILAWRIPRTEEPGRLQSIGSQRVGHN